jgi:hypothetical protein
MRGPAGCIDRYFDLGQKTRGSAAGGHEERGEATQSVGQTLRKHAKSLDHSTQR